MSRCNYVMDMFAVILDIKNPNVPCTILGIIEPLIVECPKLKTGNSRNALGDGGSSAGINETLSIALYALTRLTLTPSSTSLVLPPHTSTPYNLMSPCPPLCYTFKTWCPYYFSMCDNPFNGYYLMVRRSTSVGHP